MRAKTLLTVLFVISISVAAFVALHALSQKGDTAEAKDQILVAKVPLAAGTLLRAEDVTWRAAAGAPGPDEIVRPAAAAIAAKPELDEQVRSGVYGAVLRGALAVGDPIQLGGIVRPGDRNFLQVVLAPGARAIAIPVATGGASTGLLSPGDRVDVILTQNFRSDNAPLTRRSVSETVVENLRVLAIDALDAKTAAAASTFGRTVTLEVTPEQAEKINVATELGKLSLTLRSLSATAGGVTASAMSPGKVDGVKPTWAGDVSPALSSATPPLEKAVAIKPGVDVIHGSAKAEAVKPE
jgi:pilus assembly protein CpaB